MDGMGNVALENSSSEKKKNIFKLKTQQKLGSWNLSRKNMYPRNI